MQLALPRSGVVEKLKPNQGQNVWNDLLPFYLAK
jgi:hypothetical protein